MKTTYALVAAIATAAVVVDARQEFVALVPNGGKVSGVTALGHEDRVGVSEQLNVFGQAFQKASKKWTTELCQADSDGDGQTNGQELGDPCCEWATTGAVKWTTGLSDPGDATKKSDASQWASLSCTSTTTTPTPSAAAASTMAVTVVAVAAAGALAQW